MSFVFNSIKIILLVSLVSLIYANSKSSSIVAHSFINKDVVAEEIVTSIYFTQTPEISYHSGYILNIDYWVNPPKEQKAIVFLEL